jgi:hypothetical protein
LNHKAFLGTADHERMEETYKGHFILSDGRLLPGSSEWKPTANVYWMDGSGEHRTKRWGVSYFKGSFPTKEEAEKKAHLLVKKWIDGDKPNFETVKTL